MSFSNRSWLAVAGVVIVWAVGCTGSPTGPSQGATIAGIVNGSGGATPSDLTVRLEGTERTAPVGASGQFQIAGVPSGDANLRFTGGGTDATVVVYGIGGDETIRLQVNVNGQSAAIVSEIRSEGKVQLCHRSDGTGYHLIDVSTSAESAHRAHGDGKIGDPVPGTLTKVFNSNCQPAGVGVNIEKLTNGHDADVAPGPSIEVGNAITWTYVVTNNGASALSGIVVVDDKGVVVTCPQTSLAVGTSMTCTGTGVAVLGPYENLGTVTASSATGPRQDKDPSHYLGIVDDEGTPEPKVAICHVTGNGSFHLIEVGASAEPAHRAHGDAAPGEAVPLQTGKVFGPTCAIITAP